MPTLASPRTVVLFCARCCKAHLWRRRRELGSVAWIRQDDAREEKSFLSAVTDETRTAGMSFGCPPSIILRHLPSLEHARAAKSSPSSSLHDKPWEKETRVRIRERRPAVLVASASQNGFASLPSRSGAFCVRKRNFSGQFQPDHPAFELDGVVQSGDSNQEARLPLAHCPWAAGCRAVLANAQGGSPAFPLLDNFTLTLGDPGRKSAWLVRTPSFPLSLSSLLALSKLFFPV